MVFCFVPVAPPCLVGLQHQQFLLLPMILILLLKEMPLGLIGEFLFWDCRLYLVEVIGLCRKRKKNNGADALINVTGENKYIYLFFLNIEFMEIRGDAVKFQLEGSKLD